MEEGGWQGLEREAGGQKGEASMDSEPALLIRVKGTGTTTRIAPTVLWAYTQGGRIPWPASMLMKCKWT